MGNKYLELISSLKNLIGVSPGAFVSEQSILDRLFRIRNNLWVVVILPDKFNEIEMNEFLGPKIKAFTHKTDADKYMSEEIEKIEKQGQESAYRYIIRSKASLTIDNK
jgi:hypothetical protein